MLMVCWLIVVKCVETLNVVGSLYAWHKMMWLVKNCSWAIRCVTKVPISKVLCGVNRDRYEVRRMDANGNAWFRRAGSDELERVT